MTPTQQAKRAAVRFAIESPLYWSMNNRGRLAFIHFLLAKYQWLLWRQSELVPVRVQTRENA